MLELFAGRRGRVAAGLLVAEFVAATQSLVVTTVMPKIASDLHGIGLYGPAYASLLGASLISMSFAGPFADRYGTWRVLAVALALSFLGLLASMLATSMPVFVTARGIEGFGGGLDYAVSLTAVVKFFPDHLRRRMMALYSAMWVVPGLVGPAIGAFVAATFGWRYVFAIFIPLVAFAAALVLPAMARMPAVRSESDPFGAFRILVQPDTLLLRSPRSIAIAAFSALQAAFFGADSYISLLLTAVRGLSLNLAGVCITLAVLGWTLGSAVQPRLFERIGTRRIVIAGAVLGIIAIACMFAVAHGAPVWIAFAGWAIGGMGIGLSYATLTLAAMEGFPQGSEGTGSSATLLIGVGGSAVGIFLCGVPVTIAHNAGAPLESALGYTFGIALIFAFVLLALAMRLPRTAYSSQIES